MSRTHSSLNLPASGPRRADRDRRGTTLIEVMIVMTIMVVAASLFSRMVIATAELRGVNRENGLAAEAARVVLEEMRNQPFAQVFHLYNPDPDDDPGGPGTAPGNLFVVEGLEPLAGAPSGTSLEVVLPAFPPDTPTQLTGTKWEYEEAVAIGATGTAPPPPEPEGWTLREDFSDESLGLPRDLNGDSIIDSEDHSEDYVILPILIRIEWEGRHGPRIYEVHSMLTDFFRP
jgi:prepilin-type N-terminal cleavage/methylation domain-containing protein